MLNEPYTPSHTRSLARFSISSFRELTVCDLEVAHIYIYIYIYTYTYACVYIYIYIHTHYYDYY